VSTAGFTLAQLADRFGLQVQGDPDTWIDGVATLAQGGSSQLSFLANPSYRRALSESKAAAVVLRASDAGLWAGPALVAPDPYVAFARIAELFKPISQHLPGIHVSAVVDPSAQISPQAHVAALVSIGARSRIEANVVIGPGSVIGDDCVVGAGSELSARVTLVASVRLGQRVRIHSGAVLGADGFGLAMAEGHWINVPQLGGVQIGDDCEIGANTTIDRGALDDTILEQDVRLDNQVQIGHNVVIGAHTAMAGCAAVAGSARIGRYCLIGGGAGIVGHINLCDQVRITAMTLVTHSITLPGEYSSGTPLQDNRAWRRNAARFRQLDALAKRVRQYSQDSKK
jgi:UDP-3-O-[3-hydroxymyristoyl] glucosamine N-acyltransferase